MKFAPPILIATLALTAVPARAADDCDVPTTRWQSREAVRQMATSHGWQVQRLKIDDGCYELRAIDAQGRRVKAKIDPESLRILKIRHKERSREHRRRRESSPTADPSAESGSAASPAFTSGATPDAPID